MIVKKRLVRIGPLQLGKMLAALYEAMGLIFVPFFAVIIGLIETAIYNLFAKWIGGIEVEVE